MNVKFQEGGGQRIYARLWHKPNNANTFPWNFYQRKLCQLLMVSSTSTFLSLFDISRQMASLYYDSAFNYQCFFFTSVNIRMSSALMLHRYRNSSPAHASIHPSSATCENTNPSARMKSAPAACATAMASLLAPRGLIFQTLKII